MTNGKVVYVAEAPRYSMVVNGEDYERFNVLEVAKHAANTHKRLFPEDSVTVVDTHG